MIAKKQMVKLVSAFALLGAGFVSMNALADCYCAGGVPIGNNMCGIQNPNGQLQQVIPMICNSNNGYTSPAQPRHDLSKTGALTFAINPKNDRVFVISANLDIIFQAEKQVLKNCKADGGGRQCLQVTPLLSCAILYKQGNGYNQASEMTLSETQKLVPANAKILYQGYA